VVIGAEDIDHPVGALQFIVMVGDVVGVVGRPSVAADRDPVFVVA